MLRSPSSPSTTTPFAALRLPPPCPVDRVRTVSAPPLELPVKPPPGDLGQDSEGGPKQATSKRDPPSAFRFEAFIGIDSRIWGLITCHTMPLQRIKCLVSRHGGPNCSARTPPVSGPAWCWGSGLRKSLKGVSSKPSNLSTPTRAKQVVLSRHNRWSNPTTSSSHLPFCLPGLALRHASVNRDDESGHHPNGSHHSSWLQTLAPTKGRGSPPFAVSMGSPCPCPSMSWFPLHV